MKSVVLILSLCAFSIALVLKEKRAVNVEEHELTTQGATATTTKAPSIFCAPQTPCAWSFYNPVTKIIKNTINNTYCVCESTLPCQINEDDKAVYAFVLRCRPPVASSEDDEEDTYS